MRTRWLLLALCLGITAGVLCSGIRSRAQHEAQRIEITSKKFAFEPGEITLKKDVPVILVLKSTDVAHGLRFRELDLNLKVDKDGKSEVAFTPTKTGDFVGHCSMFCGSGHGSMTLTLHVVE